MNEHIGRLLDLYSDANDGVILWFLTDSGERLRLRMDFPVTFYAGGDFKLLRQAWRFLQGKDVALARTRRRDLFSGERDVLAITIPSPANVSKIFYELSGTFPTLDYYDADIPLALHIIARMGVHLLGRCRVELKEKTITHIEALDSAWELEPAPIPLRILKLSPGVDPTIQAPSQLNICYGRVAYNVSLKPVRPLLIDLKSILLRFDPDLILTDYGDTWLFPKLCEWDASFNPNRDDNREVLLRKANNYFAYGQVIYRGAQSHLFGRWHIDKKNALLFREIGLQGILELTRISGINVQDAARKSPGAGITAMQMLTALRTGILVPVVKQQAENRKSLAQLVSADKGGLIYQPVIGVHKHVAQIDFASMYPSIMVNYNISPEIHPEHSRMGLKRENTEDGLVPQTLRPLVHKRLALKKRLEELNPRDCRVKELKERSSALKWLLVVCFGYLGYKNARFGKIESHEAVTAISRELMLQAKEIAEDMGFTVLHMYVDSLFVQQEKFQTQKDFFSLLEAIHKQTGIPIAIEGVYKWLVFPPSKRDKRVPVPNRYYGVLQDGESKVRGIAMRRHDTSRFVSGLQLGILKILARSDNPIQKLPEARAFVQMQLDKLRKRNIPLDDLLIAKKLSRELEAYKTPSATAQAARQLKAKGINVRAGMRVKFWYVYGGVKVGEIDISEIDTQKYRQLVEAGTREIVEIFEDELSAKAMLPMVF